METWQKLLLKLIAGITTFFVIYKLVGLMFFNDFATSLTPGWHTTIYPFGGDLYLTIVIVSFTIFSYFLFKLLLRLVTYLWTKVFV
jgi:hypothetical protein